MNYTYPPEEYRKQLEKYYDAENNISFSPDDEKAQVIAKLRERTAKKREVQDVLNTMIREYIETFEKDLDSMTAEDAALLESLHYDLLSQAGVYKGELADFGICLRIAELLCRFYKASDDLSRYAMAVCYCTYWSTSMIDKHSFEKQDSPLYEDCKALLQHLDEFDDNLRLQTVLAVARMTAVSDETFAKGFPCERYQTIFDALEGNFKPPYGDTEEMIILITYCNMLDMIREYFEFAANHGLRADIDPIRPLVDEMYVFVSEHVARDRLFGADRAIIRFHLLAIDYFFGRVSLETMLEKLSGIQKEAEASEDPLCQLSALASLNHYYLLYLYKFSSLPRAEIERLSRDRIAEALPKLLQVKNTINNSVGNYYIAMFLNAASLTSSFDDFKDIILGITVYADKALFIHTAMVSRISLAIFDYMIGHDPSAFNGVAGHDTEYIRTHRKEMRELLYDCCMYHDIGKFFLIDIVENSMRRLTDEEFALIKSHPGNFDNTYHNEEEKDERVLCIRDAALAHHLWHDGTRGYPNVAHTKNRPFLDIISIADSIDAATDDIGRPYHSKKTLDDLIAEVQQDAGTRYGAEAAAVLSVPEVRSRLAYLIREEREEINYQIYATGKLKEDIPQDH